MSNLLIQETVLNPSGKKRTSTDASLSRRIITVYDHFNRNLAILSSKVVTIYRNCAQYLGNIVSSVVCAYNQFKRNQLIKEVRSGEVMFWDLPLTFRGDGEVLNAAMEFWRAFITHFTRDPDLQLFSGCPLEFADDCLKNNLQVVNQFFAVNPRSLCYAGREVVLQKVREDGTNIRYACIDHQNDEEIRRVATEQNPHALDLISDLPGIVSTFEVRIEDVNDRPLQILDNLYGKMRYDFPTIRYKDSPGIDMSGLAKDLVSKIMQAVFDLEKKPIPMDELDQKIMPLIEDEKQEQIAAYKAIGAIFAYALLERQNILTGNFFHPMLFEMMHSLTGEEMDSLAEISRYSELPMNILNKLFSIYAKNSLRLSDAQIEGILTGNIPAELNEDYSSKEDFFNDGFKKMALACAVLSYSMYSLLIMNGCDWENIKGPLKTFSTRIEGVLTRDQVIIATTLRARDPQSEPNQRTCEYISKWLNECSEEDLKQFVLTITGSLTLLPGRKLQVRLYPDDKRLPTYHTCTSTIDLPNQYASYKEFQDKLALSFSSAAGMQAE